MSITSKLLGLGLTERLVIYQDNGAIVVIGYCEDGRGNELRTSYHLPTEMLAVERYEMSLEFAVDTVLEELREASE